ncbi:MAG: LysM peptidoglycan-binding domain-containing protein [Oscillatoria princeps RMCB-10]|jgi:hypothetical protein|nr:LysM peptidoglycan-binding domain-containing protein [Oscillatoria princeps RMCB-10]
MALEKLKIAIEENYPTFGRPVEVLFNPQQIQISRSGGTVKEGQLVGGEEPATLTIELFFDTTLGKSGPEDVQRYTKTIYNLTRKKGKLNRPPLCRLMWGKGSVWFLQGFLKQVSKTLTHFLEDGTPVRAKLNCTFEEWVPPEYKQKSQNPIDDPTRIVRRGETLSSIAAEEYSDPSLWRVIADANKISNPRAITPGQILTVPPLRAGSATSTR